MNKKLLLLGLVLILLVFTMMLVYQKVVAGGDGDSGLPKSCPPGCYCNANEGPGICVGGGNCGGSCQLRPVKIN